MTSQDKNRIMLSAGVVAALVILWLLTRGADGMTSGGTLGDIAGPGGVTIQRNQIPGLMPITMPAPWTPPAKSCGCGCTGSRATAFNLSGYPPGVLAAQSGVF
jgi:hypothetical protein